jgi:hypothetical protein
LLNGFNVFLSKYCIVNRFKYTESEFDII